MAKTIRVGIKPTTFDGMAGYLVKFEDRKYFVLGSHQAKLIKARVKAGKKPIPASMWAIKLK